MRRKNLYCHLRAVHKCIAEEVDRIKLEVCRLAAAAIAPEAEHVVCPICQETFHSHELLAEHCGAEHVDDGAKEQQDYYVLNAQFKTKEDYDVRI